MPRMRGWRELRGSLRASRADSAASSQRHSSSRRQARWPAEAGARGRNPARRNGRARLRGSIGERQRAMARGGPREVGIATQNAGLEAALARHPHALLELSAPLGAMQQELHRAEAVDGMDPRFAGAAGSASPTARVPQRSVRPSPRRSSRAPRGSRTPSPAWLRAGTLRADSTAWLPGRLGWTTPSGHICSCDSRQSVSPCRRRSPGFAVAREQFLRRRDRVVAAVGQIARGGIARQELGPGRERRPAGEAQRASVLRGSLAMRPGRGRERRSRRRIARAPRRRRRTPRHGGPAARRRAHRAAALQSALSAVRCSSSRRRGSSEASIASRASSCRNSTASTCDVSIPDARHSSRAPLLSPTSASSSQSSTRAGPPRRHRAAPAPRRSAGPPARARHHGSCASVRRSRRRGPRSRRRGCRRFAGTVPRRRSPRSHKDARPQRARVARS